MQCFHIVSVLFPHSEFEAAFADADMAATRAGKVDAGYLESSAGLLLGSVFILRVILRSFSRTLISCSAALPAATAGRSPSHDHRTRSAYESPSQRGASSITRRGACTPQSTVYRLPDRGSSTDGVVAGIPE